ncbi:MAG: outer membrane beta-barrel protein [Candidatus Nitrotoga sp.]
MGKFKSGLAGAVLLASVSGSAWAAEVGGFYGAVDVGMSTLHGFCDAATAVGITASCDESDVGFRGAVGYQVTPNWAVEAGYGSYGTATASGGGRTLEGEVTSFQISAVGSYLVADAFSVTGKLGLAMVTQEATATLGGVSTSAKDDGTDAVLGVGILYNINQSVGIRAQWETITSDDATDLLSAGVVFNF